MSPEHARLVSIRPLVRYVDEAVAVIDTHVTAHLPGITDVDDAQPGAAAAAPIELIVELHGPGGELASRRSKIELHHGSGMLRFELPHPRRWWPVGMGEQALYGMTVALIVDNQAIDCWETTIGMTSVRPAGNNAAALQLVAGKARRKAEWDRTLLLVNGHPCTIDSVLPIDPKDEQHVLAVGDHCLLMVRDHFGPDVLYEAADRAGILLVQSVPEIRISAEGGNDVEPPAGLQAQIDRLACHPSLAGWFVGRMGKMADRLKTALRRVDPTRCVFDRLPGEPGAM